MSMNFTILGPGAIGSILGAHLARAGHSVTLIARGGRAKQIKAEGLRIRGLAEFSVPVRVIENPAELKRTGALIIATKTPGTAQTLATLRHVELDTVFSIQNGVQKNDLLAQTFGREKVLGALADTSGELLPSGEVLFTRNVNLTLGELTGSTHDRASKISACLDAAGVRSSAVPDIESLEWSKFVVWGGLMLLAVTTRVETWKYLDDPDCALLVLRATRELGALADATGIQITDRSMLPAATLLKSSDEEGIALIRQSGLDYFNKAPQHRMSALQDLLANRALEVHETIGGALGRAAALGVAMPLIENLYRLVAGIDRLRAARSPMAIIPAL